MFSIFPPQLHFEPKIYAEGLRYEWRCGYWTNFLPLHAKFTTKYMGMTFYTRVYIKKIAVVKFH